MDLAPGDTFAALEAQLKRRIAERFDNAVLGISATIGSKRNASELAKHLASGEQEEAHKFAAKNVGMLFARGRLGISHDDKKAVVGQRWITRFIRVFTPFRFAGDDYLATLTLKDVDPDKGVYAVEAVEINQDAKSRSTPRGAISEDLNSAPFQDLTSQLLSMVSYYVGDVNRTHPKFFGRDEMFSTERTVKLLEGVVQDFCASHQPPTTNHQPPKFSIIIPVYNVASYLRECLDSVCEAAEKVKVEGVDVQWKNHPFVEVICVDDGSTDGSGSILDEYAKRKSNNQIIFRVIHQKNAGVGAARNAALDRATGEYIVFVDGDDGLVPNALEILEQQVAATKADVIQFGHLTAKSLENSVQEAVLSRVQEFDLDNQNEAYRAYHKMVGSLIAWNACYRRSTVADERFQPIPNGEDIVFAAECFCRARRVATLDARLYRYVRREGSAVRTINLRHIKSALRAIEETDRLTREWKWASSVGDLRIRKNRTGLMNVVALKLPLVPLADRREAEEAFYDTLGRLAWNTPSRIVAVAKSRVLRKLLLEWPFALRVWLLKVVKKCLMRDQ